MKEGAPKTEGLVLGIELFNRGEFFEAHEVLEDVWRVAPAGTARRRHLQGMVQLAVAFHHESQGNLVGARSVLARGVRNLMGGEDSLPELDLDRLRVVLADWQRHLGEALDVAAADSSPAVRSRTAVPRHAEPRPALPQIRRRRRAWRRAPARISEK